MNKNLLVAAAVCLSIAGCNCSGGGTPGIVVNPTSGLTTTEAGGTATFTIALASQPSSEVKIPLSSSSVAEGTVSAASLTFTTENWNAPQKVTVTGVDDRLADGPVAYKIITGKATSSDSNYSGLDADDVAVSNTDDDTPGITVTPITGLVTTEAGGSASFTVVLNSQPSADVTLGLTSSKPAEGTVSPASLVFTPANWNAPQTVTVKGVNDALADGPQLYQVVTAPAASTDPGYAGVNPADVDVSNTDNDSPGFTLTPSTGLTTTESGGTATFTVVLNSQPSADVTLGLTSSVPAEGTVAPASLVFTPANWNAPQTVTVTGVDDSAADGDQVYSIVTAAAASTDTGYAGVNPADVSVTNTDNDSAGVTVTPTTGLTTTEAGGTATFTVVLNTQPGASVTIALSSSKVGEGTVSPASLVFTTANWNAPQTVTVTGVNDAVADGNQVYLVVTAAATSTDPKYAGVNPADVAVSNTDNDSPGFTLVPTTALTTTEAGGAATFTLVLNSQPTGSVTVGLTSSNVAEGTVSPASLVFTTANWNAPQTVTVTGVNDAVADGNQVYSVITAAATSTDPGYSALDPADVAASNTDNDSPGFTVTPTTGLVTTEGGGTATFTVVLNSQPTASVTVDLSSSAVAEGTVSPASVVFTTANWNAPQTVTVTGINDAVQDGAQVYTIATAPAVSTDTNYNAVNPADVSVSNTDNDSAGITVTPTTGLVTTEGGGAATFTVVLNSQPTAGVTIDLASSAVAEGGISPATLTFTTANWNAPQTVTVTGVNDSVADGNQVYTVTTAPAVSTDATYDAIDAADVSVSNTDNDSAGITLSATSGLVTTEGGGTSTFTVVLNSQPTASVSVALSSSNVGEGTVGPASLTFTTANWNAPQTVTVTGVNDAVADGAQSYSIVTAAAVSTDTSYDTLDALDVGCSNTDDDSAGITVAAAGNPLVTTEGGGTATFTVVLNTQPVANVTVGLSSSRPAEGTVAPASLVFTAANWNAPQTVTVTGVNDAIADGNQLFTVVTAPATSTDASYSNLNAVDVPCSNTDNDTAGITVSASANPLVTTEAGLSATFTVVLNTQPTAGVTVALSSSRVAEGTVAPASLTFTTANWNAPQTVTVTGVNDATADGNQLYAIVTAPATSTDTNYNNLNAVDVPCSNTDNDTAGITVVAGATPLITTEAGGAATFTVVLNSQPTAPVSIGVSSSRVAEGTVAPASLTFTTANWNAPQTLTVTGVNDAIADGNQLYTVVTAAATSTDATYSGVNAADVAISNTDNDTAGVTVTPAANPLLTTEAGGSSTFTVVLNSQPTANVTIGLSSSNTTEGTVSVPSVTFTTGNWSSPVTVTVTGVNDLVADGNQTYSILTAAATSTDGTYNNLNAADVACRNTDNDSAGITVNPTSGLVTSEFGTTATFTVVLNSQPTANVTIGLSVSNAEATVTPSITFTPANYNVAQTVTVTGADDLVPDGAQPFTLLTAPATSTDGTYNTLNAPDVTGTNTDNDTAGITVAPVAGLLTTEAGGTATFSVKLDAQPTGNVTIGLASSNSSEGIPSTALLTFTSANWNAPQVITVTGVDDAAADGAVGYSIVTAPAASTDARYQGMDAPDVAVSNTDNDTAGVTVTPVAGLTTTEAGGQATFDVVLNSQPTSNVTIGLSTTDTNEGTPSPAALVFTPANWNAPQQVTVTGVNDLIADGSRLYSIATGAATSTDGTYAGLDAADVSVTNTDNDSAGITVAPLAGLITTEAGLQATFTVVLNSQPTANVVIGLSSSNAGEGTVSPAALTFTAANWSSAQTVTVTGVNDAVQDGNQGYTILTAAAVSADGTYNGLDGANVGVSNTDNDTAGVTVTPVAGLITTEAGGSDTFSIVLNSQPVADVTIAISSSAVAEGTVSPAVLTFTSVNWNAPHLVTVTGVNDAVQDGNQGYSVVTGNTASTDGNYNGLGVAEVGVSNTDNDTAGITVSAISGPTTEAGGTATFTLVLNSQPTGSVSIGLSSSSVTEATVPAAPIVFTAANWNAPQTITVTGVDDAVQDGNQSYSIVTAAASSTDTNYDNLASADVAGTNTDNDSAGFTVTPTSGLVTTEAGGTATFNVVLNSQPVADVDVDFASTDLTEGTVAPATHTFTPANWNSPHTVTLTGVNDLVQDGNQPFQIITGPVTSADLNYDATNVPDVLASNTDNDSAGITVTPITGVTSGEDGTTGSFSVVLTSQPTADVTIALSSNDLTEGTITTTLLTFTAGNFAAAQFVTVTGVDDAVADGNQSYAIVTAAATSADPNYSGLNANDVAVSNIDDDSPGITLDPGNGVVVTETGATDTFTVVLNSQPTASVTVGLVSSDTTEGLVSPASLTFTPANWNAPQQVTVTGVDDLVADSTQFFFLRTQPATSADPLYNGFNGPDQQASTIDNDSAGITVTALPNLVTTEAGGTATFTVVLNSQPTSNVTLPLTSLDGTEGAPSPASVIFTPVNWNAPRTITVTGGDDLVQDGNIQYFVRPGPASSADTGYNGLSGVDVELTNTDNDSAGITVTALPNLVTTEAGGSATFTVVLNSQPTSNVVVPLQSDDGTEGLPSANLTFTAANWNAPQTVTVTGADDAVQDGPQPYTILVQPAVSADGNYANRDAADVGVTNTDNDSAGISVTPTSGLVTTEAGGTASFSIVLNSQPVSDVTINVSSSNNGEGLPAPTSLVFTAANWNSPHVVTVSGVDDPLLDGAQPYTILTSATSSTDPNYTGRNVDDVTVSNTDNDTAGVTVTPAGGLVTTESSGQASFNVVLNSQPASNVTISITSTDLGEGTVNVSSLVFTPVNWNALHTVTVTGIDDALADGNQPFTIVTGAATSFDLDYDTLDPIDVSVTNNDNDIAGFTINPGFAITFEDGTAFQNTIVLTSQPTANVTINLSSSDVGEGIVSPTSVTFSPANWNLAQTLTVTGIDDGIVDNVQFFTILTAPAVSADPGYSGFNGQDINCANIDDDAPGITVSAPNQPLATSEAGGTATFSLRLNSAPSSNVVIPLQSNDPGEGSVAPSVTFTPANWNLPQTITVTGVDDALADGDQQYQAVTGAAVSTDPGYSGLNAADVSLVNLDNEP